MSIGWKVNRPLTSRKEIQMSRMWKYFVDATVQIIEAEGMDHVTVRKVAEAAGYTTSTLYNYFEEFSHLLFFASMRFLKDYTRDLTDYMARGRDSIEKHLLAWECFCHYSFKNPQVYYAIFISDLGSEPHELFNRYYSHYQTDLSGISDEIKPLVFEYSLSKRSQSVLERAVQENLLDWEDIDAITEMAILIWKGMLTTMMNNRRTYSYEEAVQKTMKYIREITFNHIKTANATE